MKLELKGNPNYCATIAAIESIIPLENCDNICGTVIQGCYVIVSKDVKVGDVGIFFPVECSIKDIFLKVNNLYRDKELNVDKTKAGFFEEKGRVRCMKLRGFKSEGLFMPFHSLKFIIDPVWDSNTLPIGTDFDHIDGQMICEKYIIKSKTQGTPNSKKDKKSQKVKRFDKLIPNYFKLHIDTSPLAKNLHYIHPDDIISITEKLHGTSFVSSNILCNRKLTWFEIICVKLRKWAEF